MRLASFPDSETAAATCPESRRPWSRACGVADNVCTKMFFAFLSLPNYDEGKGANKSSDQNRSSHPLFRFKM
jgi:hypothetical protein